MTCNKSAMLKAILALGILSLVLYATLPGLRAWIISALPILLILVCPLSMLACMFGMRHASDSGQKCASKTEPPSQPNV